METKETKRDVLMGRLCMARLIIKHEPVREWPRLFRRLISHPPTLRGMEAYAERTRARYWQAYAGVEQAVWSYVVLTTRHWPCFSLNLFVDKELVETLIVEQDEQTGLRHRITELLDGVVQPARQVGIHLTLLASRPPN